MTTVDAILKIAQWWVIWCLVVLLSLAQQL